MLQSEISITPIYSYLLSNEKEYLLVDYVGMQVLRFSKFGELLNTIGHRGQGPGEFANIKDVNIKEGNRVQILGDDGIFEYDLEGAFLTKKENPISSFSFVEPLMIIITFLEWEILNPKNIRWFKQMEC